MIRNTVRVIGSGVIALALVGGVFSTLTSHGDPVDLPGLSAQQARNAAVIVQVGQQQKIPQQGMVIAIATALSESNLLNLANPNVPASLKYPHDGVKSDHDGLGLFQTRAALAGPVGAQMSPQAESQTFYAALLKVGGWEGMSVGTAAQTVQRSSSPDSYTSMELAATKIVDVLTQVPTSE